MYPSAIWASFLCSFVKCVTKLKMDSTQVHTNITGGPNTNIFTANYTYSSLPTLEEQWKHTYPIPPHYHKVSHYKKKFKKYFESSSHWKIPALHATSIKSFPLMINLCIQFQRRRAFFSSSISKTMSLFIFCYCSPGGLLKDLVINARIVCYVCNYIKRKAHHFFTKKYFIKHISYFFLFSQKPWAT